MQKVELTFWKRLKNALVRDKLSLWSAFMVSIFFTAIAIASGKLAFSVGLALLVLAIGIILLKYGQSSWYLLGISGLSFVCLFVEVLKFNNHDAWLFAILALAIALITLIELVGRLFTTRNT